MKPHEAWLKKAEHDLRSAKQLIHNEAPILDTAIYHTQQCAEKALKAYLAYKQQPSQKMHDVELLVEQCFALDSSFEALYAPAETLNPYDTAYRYPDDDMEPEKMDVLDAIRKAETIFEFVKNKLT